MLAAGITSLNLHFIATSFLRSNSIHVFYIVSRNMKLNTVLAKKITFRTSA